MNAASLLLATATVVAGELVCLSIHIVRTGSMVSINVLTYLVSLKIWPIQLTARPHMLRCIFVTLGQGWLW